jgi:hypothetical protein
MSTVPARVWIEGNKSKALVKGKRYLVKRIDSSKSIEDYVERPSKMADGTLEFDTEGAYDIGYESAVAFMEIEED